MNCLVNIKLLLEKEELDCQGNVKELELLELYHNPKILVLDEATNALDNVTEQAVMDALNNLSKQITIILITHRLNTKKCNKIYLFDKGKIKNEGTFEELIKLNENFLINANNK